MPPPSFNYYHNCHGRVKDEDFERMVPEQWWKTVFADGLYLKTDGDVVEDPEITKEEIRMLEENEKIKEILQRGHEDNKAEQYPNVLDLCCGQGRHTLLLAERYAHLNLFGHDQSSFLIALARERANMMSSKRIPNFTVGDCRSVPFHQDFFDFVMIMGNSFGYFSASEEGQTNDVDQGDRSVLMEINRVLKMGGRMVLDLADGDYMRENFSPRSWEWIDDQTFVCRERVLSQDKKRLHSREVVVVVARGVVRDQFYSERLYGKQELIQLLHETGFEIEIEEQQQTSQEGVNTVTAARELSQRGQDLGMMEQRLLIFAKKVEQLKVKPSKLETQPALVPHPFMSAENAQSVRDWIERLSSQFDSPGSNEVDMVDYTKAVQAYIQSIPAETHGHPQRKRNESAHSLVKIPTRSLLREWIERVILPQSPAVLSCETPSLYHLLPPPPFPKHQITIIMGDTSINCREKLNGVWNKEDFETRKKMVDALLSLGYQPHQLKILENHKELVKWLISQPPSFVFNLCDEGFMNDATKELHVCSILEMINCPYSGAGPLSLGVCYDKGLVNSTANKLNVATPRETYILIPEAVEDVSASDLDSIVEGKERAGDLTYPAFIKPMKGDNSLGITGRSIVHTREDLVTYILSLFHSYQLKEFIIQEYLTGSEYSVGMIGNPETGFHFLPILQVDYSKVLQEGLEPILGWESKWDPESPYWTDIEYVVARKIPKFNSKLASEKQRKKVEYLTGGLTEEEEEELKRSCIVLFERFGCRDYARFDWRADKEIHYDPETGEVHPFSPQPNKSSSQPRQEEDVLSHYSNDDERNMSDSGRGSSHDSSDEVRPQSSTDSSNTQQKRHRRLKLLEVNPNPGWCWDGKLAKMAAVENISYPNLLKCILWASWERCFGHGKGDGRRMLAEWCSTELEK